MKKTEVECCDTFCIHEELVHKAEGHIPDEEVLKDLADFFKVFADTTRIRILCVLFQSEMCVCDLAEVLGMTQSAISAPDAQADEACEEQTGRKNGVLFPC